MKKAALYIRVSTQEQALEGYSIGAQKDRLINYCKAHDWIISDIYVDGGYSGSNLNRPGIQKLIEEIDKTDIVLVYKLDRLSRSQKDMLHLIEDIFLPSNVDFVSMNESFDTSTPFGRAMIGILSVFAQLEREQIKERSLMGRNERAKEGLFHGGPFYPIGYDYIDGRLVINEYEAAQIRKIYDWYIGGLSPRKISERLRAEGYTNKYGSWKSESSIISVLTTDVYLGTIKYNDVVKENAHEPIISHELFEKVALERKKRRKKYGDSAYKSNYLLQGLLFCGKCGARYYIKHNYGIYKYYTCYSRGKTAPHLIKDPNCNNRNWHIPELEKIVEDEICRLAFDPFYFKSLTQKKELSSKNKLKDEETIINLNNQ
ncbi:MAG: recombinase family protein [Oscillospiraceae bacterium]|nr:recombinase family protein [Oscillospiraceae bacterium]